MSKTSKTCPVKKLHGNLVCNQNFSSSFYMIRTNKKEKKFYVKQSSKKFVI